MKKIVLLNLVIFVFLSCSYNKGIKTGSFFDKIDVSDWNDKTLIFLKSHSNSKIFNSYKDDYIKNRRTILSDKSDTIKSTEEHLNYYFKHRKDIISRLKSHIELFPDNIESLIVIENYYGLRTLDVSYTIYTDIMSGGLRFYYEKGEFKKIEKLSADFKKTAFDSIITSKPKCITNYDNYFNVVNFDNVFHLDDKEVVNLKVKNGFLGNYILD